MHRTPSKVVIPNLIANYKKYINKCKLVENYANLCIEPLQKLSYSETSRPAGLDRLACSLYVSVVELAIYIYLFLCKPHPTGWRHTSYRQKDRRNVGLTPIVIGEHTDGQTKNRQGAGSTNSGACAWCGLCLRPRSLGLRPCYLCVHAIMGVA